MAVFVDGVRLAETSGTGPIVYARGNAFTVGSMNGGRLFLGDVDDVRVYDSALGDEEIAALAQ